MFLNPEDRLTETSQLLLVTISFIL